MGSNLPGNISYSYNKFTGKEIGYFKAEPEDIIIFEYIVEVDEGSLDIQIEDSDQEILWNASLQKNAEDKVQLSLKREGDYQITIIGNETSGRFHISWKLQ
jgi:hypothetical protein